MRIALTGASGFIGSVVARRLHDSGHQVTGLVRATSRVDHLEGIVDRFVMGDQADESCWKALLEGAECVVHNSVDWDPLREPVDYPEPGGFLHPRLEGIGRRAARPRSRNGALRRLHR